MKDENTYWEKMARNCRNTVIYKGTFVSNQSLGLGFQRLCCHLNFNWAAKQEISWVVSLWRICVSLWWIHITFVWPRGSLKLPAPSSWSECHLHFTLIRLCLALLFNISIQYTTLQSLTGKLQGRITTQSHYREWVYRVQLSSVLVTFLSLF